MTHSRRVAVRVAIAGLALLVSAASAIGTARAHEGAARIEVLSADAPEPLAVTYRVRFTSVADGHGLDEASLTAVAEDATGVSTTPVPLEPAGETGVYRVTVRFPSSGAWTVRFTAVNPATSLERAETVAPPPTTAASTITTQKSDAPAEPRGGVRAGLLMLVIALVIVCVVALLLLSRRRRTSRA